MIILRQMSLTVSPKRGLLKIDHICTLGFEISGTGDYLIPQLIEIVIRHRQAGVMQNLEIMMTQNL